MLEDYLDHKFQWSQEGLNCKSLASPLFKIWDWRLSPPAERRGELILRFHLERKYFVMVYMVYITYHKYYTTNIFIWQSGLITCFRTDCFHSNYHTLKWKVFFFCDRAWKHPVYVISQTKCITNIFNFQMLNQNVFFVSWSGLKMFCSVYYQSQVHSKYFCMAVRLENIISWRLLVTIFTWCTSSINLSENICCFMAWVENI